MEPLDMVKLAQRAENEFVGVRCGIMDQFINIFGRPRTVLKLDCRSLEHAYYPFDRDDLQIVLCDTRVKRELASSEYNVRRCGYVVGENERVESACRALERGDFSSFGGHMNASHDGLRDDYQVSCRELDILVEAARSAPGVLGSRLMGAGFGGCTINLVKADALEEFQNRVGREYRAQTGRETLFYFSRLSSGTAVLDA